MQRIILSIIVSIGLMSAANAQCATGYTQLNNVFVCQQNTGGAPVITSPATASGTVGSPFSYTITATNSPTSFSASPLPSPLAVDTSTGVISGTPTAASSTTVVLGATNTTGTGNENLALTIGSTNVPISAVNLTNGTSSLSGLTVNTASISPGANKLDIVTVQSFFNGTTTAPTVTGAGGTWQMIATQADASNNRRVTMFRDMSATPGSGPLTITFGQAGTPEAWSVDEYSNVFVDTAGHGAGAIVQSVGMTVASSTTTGASVTLAPLFSPNDATAGYVRINNVGPVTAGSGFTQLANINNQSIFEGEWAIGKIPVTWTWPSQVVVTVGVAVEIKSATP